MARISFVLLLLLSLLFNCKTQTTEPKPEPDTTSHDYVWRIDTLGIGGSFLKDISILNKNDIWAAGEIIFKDTYTYDSLGNFIEP